MALTQRQINCFEKNSQFVNEVAAALLVIAANTMAQALVVLNTPEASEVERTFAAIRQRIADQILREQGINVQGATMGMGMPALPGQTATGGSTAMRYLIQQMLLQSTWTMTPDQWAADEMLARATITASMATLMQNLTAIPTQP
jgi:hypothetical protein